MTRAARTPHDAPPSRTPLAPEQLLRRLIGVGRQLTSELTTDAVLTQIVELAVDLTGARFVALGVLDRDRLELERFITKGIDQATQQAIGVKPRGLGVLGLLIEVPRPLRLDDLTDHPRSYGFPAGHPAMGPFLGVPVFVAGQAWGNLYLTGRPGDPGFSDDDEQAVVTLADWAGIAVHNARAYDDEHERREKLGRAVRRLEATNAIARALNGETDLERVLELVAKRSRAVVEAGAVRVWLRAGDGLRLGAAAGGRVGAEVGDRVAIVGPFAEALQHGRLAREQGPPPSRSAYGRPESIQPPGDICVALYLPLIHRERVLGLIEVRERQTGSDGFGVDDEQVMDGVAAVAAAAVAAARSLEDERVRRSIASAENERKRWARELHDDTLQGLAALRLQLKEAMRSDSAQAVAETVRACEAQVVTEIANLRALIADLRPPALDELGILPALEALVARVRAVENISVDALIDVAPRAPGVHVNETAELETTMYRVVQESLTNAVRHAHAQTVRVRVQQLPTEIEIEIIDDGDGFDATVDGAGFGLTGMRERVALLGGDLKIASGPEGTTVRARLPGRLDAASTG